ncbi:MAG: outer membrane beta-barrel protein [Candidatus Acidiferrales bacterium]
MGIVLGIVLLPCIVRAQEGQPQHGAKPADTTAAGEDPQGDDATGDRAVVSSAADSASAGADQSGSSGAAAAGPSTAATPASGAPAQQNATQNTAEGNFFQRLANTYKEAWKGAAASGPAPAFRGDPAAVNGPPFPFSTWPIGGTVTIGYPWTQSGPLMEAIWSGKHGDWWKKNGIQIYGWLNFGGNFSTSHNVSNGQALCGATPPLNCKYGNSPTSYDEVPNSIQPDQEVIYIERQPDTVQTDHLDWGFRIANLWGLDYRFTTANGIFSQQLLSKNKEYGDDPVMVYADLYFPQVAQGMDVRIGRYISLPDIEAQLAPNNYTYSHSLLYTFDCYTQTGINTTTKINNHWTVQVGVSPGCEIAPWKETGRLAKLTLNFCLQYSWRETRDQLYFCDNSLNSGKYAYNNLNAFYLTWYHVINKSWHSSTESWYQYERDTPNLNNPNVGLIGSTVPDPILIFGANGARCNNTTETTCFAPEWAMVNYVEDQLNAHNYISIRNEVFDDIRGQRTGVKGWYTEHLLGWGHWIGTTVLLRPEVRWEHIYNPNLGLLAPPPGTKNELPGSYDNGLRHSQLTLAGDIIWFF